MHPRFLHPSAAERDHPAGTALALSASAASRTADMAAALQTADRACCCLAQPVVIVVLPPTTRRRHPVDLLLCGHHYYASRDALATANATIYDSREVTADVGQQSQDPVRAS
ncbi:MAG TPA: hypothetical protein VLW50_05045 [Streptosporangiaceae bacterium]|nr:hypothetical protein [Streptosporangiaceae bacterium]